MIDTATVRVVILIGCTVVAGCSGTTDPAGFAGLSPADIDYYVNQADACASNTLCDGTVLESASTDCESVRPTCPFKDFSTTAVRQTTCLADRTLAVAAGTYDIEGMLVCGDPDGNGLAIGADDTQIVCQDWRDGQPTVWLKATTTSPPFNVVTVKGRRSAFRGCGVQGDTNNNYLINVGGGGRTSYAEQLTVDNVYLKNGHNNDCVKGFDGSDYVTFSNSIVENCKSQALDITAVAQWKIHDNEFFSTDPAMPLDGAFGAKTGAKPTRKTATYVEFYNNNVHDFAQGVSMGGTGSDCDTFPQDLPCPLAATNIDVHDNTFTGSCGVVVVQMLSCKDCTVTDNTITVTGAGCVPIRFTVGLNKPPSQDSTVTGNTITSGNNAFLAHTTGTWDVQAPLTAGNNTYISGSAPNDWIFAYDDLPVTFAQWKTSTGTDSTSTTSP